MPKTPISSRYVGDFRARSRIQQYSSNANQPGGYHVLFGCDAEPFPERPVKSAPTDARVLVDVANRNCILCRQDQFKRFVNRPLALRQIRNRIRVVGPADVQRKCMRQIGFQFIIGAARNPLISNTLVHTVSQRRKFLSSSPLAAKWSAISWTCSAESDSSNADTAC